MSTQSLFADGSRRGFGHFRPLNGAEEKVQSANQRDRYTAGSGYELRPYAPVPSSPSVQYHFRGSPKNAQRRYVMPNEPMSEISTPRFNPGQGKPGSAEWGETPPAKQPYGRFTGNPALAPDQVYPRYRFRPQEKAVNKIKR
ncbi:MAG: hypothetical protein OQL27_10615 [Sedimenticola sp.]|nr:hypothetical protein [Sedimenticola sp.]